MMLLGVWGIAERDEKLLDSGYSLKLDSECERKRVKCASRVLT